MPDNSDWKQKIIQREKEEAERRRLEYERVHGTPEQQARRREEERKAAQQREYDNRRQAEDDQMARHRRKFHCHIQGCPNVSKGPATRQITIREPGWSGGESYEGKYSTYADWTEPTGLTKCKRWLCRGWTCDLHIHNGICKNHYPD